MEEHWVLAGRHSGAVVHRHTVDREPVAAKWVVVATSHWYEMESCGYGEFPYQEP